jgi:hypothetical protein
MDNKIEIYQRNTKTFTCTSPIVATGYTPYLTVKRKMTDASTLVFVAGTVTDPSTIIFTVSSTDSSLNAGDYPYDITLEADPSVYTIVKDVFSVINGVRY